MYFQEGKALLAGEDVGGTRQETAKKRQSREKSTNKRLSTVDKVLEEGLYLFMFGFRLVLALWCSSYTFS